MKKQLLLTVALGFGASAFAATSLSQSENAPVAVVANANALMSEKIESSVNAVMPLISMDEEATRILSRAAATDSLTAWYKLPGGGFYLGSVYGYWLNPLMENNLLIPNGVNLTWGGFAYKFGNGQTWKTANWEYEIQKGNDGNFSMEQGSYDDQNLVTPPYYNLRTQNGAYKSPAPTFFVNKGAAGLVESSFQAVPGGMLASEGLPRFNFGSTVGVRSMGLAEVDLTRVLSAKYTSGFSSATEDSLALVNFTNVKPGEKYYTSGEYMTRFGAFLPKPAKTFGLDSICVTGGFNSFEDVGVTVDVYEAEPVEGMVTYNIGKRIGGGFLPKEKVRVDPKYVYPNVFPITDEKGNPTFVNIDTDVIILIGGFSTRTGSDMSVYELAAPSSSPLQYMHNCVIEIADPTTNEVLDVRYVRPGSTNADGIKFSSIGWFIQYYGGYTHLVAGDEPEDYFTMTVPAEGGSKEFVFNPYYDIATNGKFTGEGANEWVTFDVADQDFIDYTQTVTVNVDALPEGLPGRETTVYVEISGARQAIKIAQGEVSGIDGVDADASEVVATEYYDLQGRALQAAPESGLFLKKEIRENGKVSTVKVVK